LNRLYIYKLTNAILSDGLLAVSGYIVMNLIELKYGIAAFKN